MTENTTESVLILSLVTEQECQRRVEQARAEAALRMWKDCALALDGVRFPENASLGGVWAACSRAIQDLEPREGTMIFITDEAIDAERERRQMMAPDPRAVAIEELERGIEELECQNELMRNDLDHYKQEYTRVCERLAATEAREQAVIEARRELVGAKATDGKSKPIELAQLDFDAALDVMESDWESYALNVMLAQVWDEAALHMWKDCVLAIDTVPFSEDVSLDSVWAACSHAIQALEPSKVKETDDGSD